VSTEGISITHLSKSSKDACRFICVTKENKEKNFIGVEAERLLTRINLLRRLAQFSRRLAVLIAEEGVEGKNKTNSLKVTTTDNCRRGG